MSSSIIKPAEALLLIAAFAFASATGAERRQSSKACLTTIGQHFGKRVVAAAPIYEVSREYAVEIRVGSNCDVQEMKIAPKYSWQEEVPKWIEPAHTVSLTENQYNEIRSRIGRLKSLGSLITKSDDTVYYVTNSKTHHWDHYENAFINRVMHCCPGDKPELMFSFAIYFLHKVEGEVSGIKPAQPPSAFQISRVKIDDHWYLASAAEFQKAKIGTRAVLNVAGPVN